MSKQTTQAALDSIQNRTDKLFGEVQTSLEGIFALFETEDPQMLELKEFSKNMLKSEVSRSVKHWIESYQRTLFTIQNQKDEIQE